MIFARRLRLPFEDLVIHDIRRTCRTRFSALPVEDIVRELLLAHARPGLHKVYDLHAYEKEKADALKLWHAKADARAPEVRAIESLAIGEHPSTSDWSPIRTVSFSTYPTADDTQEFFDLRISFMGWYADLPILEAQ
jgi:hypothetical protein